MAYEIDVDASALKPIAKARLYSLAVVPDEPRIEARYETGDRHVTLSLAGSAAAAVLAAETQALDRIVAAVQAGRTVRQRTDGALEAEVPDEVRPLPGDGL